MNTVVGNVANYLKRGISLFINNILKESFKLFQVKILQKMQIISIINCLYLSRWNLLLLEKKSGIVRIIIYIFNYYFMFKQSWIFLM